MVATADGSDTGGSLRNPAAWNNVVGFRPTVRVVPHVGPGNAWMPISTRGPMGRTVDDVALLLGVLGAPDGARPDAPADRPARRAAAAGAAAARRVVAATSACRSSARSSTCSPVPARRWSTSAGTSSTTSRTLAAAERLLPRAAGVEHRQRSARRTLHDRIDQIKATIQDEIRRGTAVSAAEVATAYAQLAALWHETVAFFDRGYDLLACPVTQVVAVPGRGRVPDRGRRRGAVQLHRLDGGLLADHRDRAARRCRCRPGSTPTGCPSASSS